MNPPNPRPICVRAGDQKSSRGLNTAPSNAPKALQRASRSVLLALQAVQLIQLGVDGLALARPLAADVFRCGLLLCQPQAAAFVVVLPVIQIIVIGQHHRHVRSVIGEFVHGPRPGAQRMRRAPPCEVCVGGSYRAVSNSAAKVMS